MPKKICETYNFCQITVNERMSEQWLKSKKLCCKPVWGFGYPNIFPHLLETSNENQISYLYNGSRITENLQFPFTNPAQDIDNEFFRDL